MQEITDRREFGLLRIARRDPRGKLDEALGAVEVVLPPDNLQIVSLEERIRFVEDRDESILVIRCVHGSQSLTGATGSRAAAEGREQAPDRLAEPARPAARSGLLLPP